MATWDSRTSSWSTTLNRYCGGCKTSSNWGWGVSNELCSKTPCSAMPQKSGLQNAPCYSSSFKTCPLGYTNAYNKALTSLASQGVTSYVSLGAIQSLSWTNNGCTSTEQVCSSSWIYSSFHTVT